MGGGYGGGWGGFPEYVPVAERRRRAAATMAARSKKGEVITPVTDVGKKIAQTFWGRAWCDNLEHYSDFASRLPRGKTYVRNGSVVHLAISRGEVKAYVSGSDVYTVTAKIKPVDKTRWAELSRACAGKVGSAVELLRGKFSDAVMAVLVDPKTGLFPTPREIDFDCSCPDGAFMCKHIAAALYGVGARLDKQPELLFVLRGADPTELVAKAAEGAVAVAAQASGKTSRLAGEDLGALFGIELAGDDAPAQTAAVKKQKPGAPTSGATAAAARKPAAKKAVARQTSSAKPAAPTKPAPKKPARAAKASKPIR